MKQKKLKFELIGNKRDLESIVLDLEKEKAIAVDLEADSMFHFQEKVCLIQISAPNKNIIIDPLTIDDLSPLSNILSNPDIQKVFHGADYDMRSLYRDFGFEVNSLFDTHIAARFLGIKEIGLANLLHDKFGVDLEKKYQKMDWSKRPLPEAMLNYAVQDTCYLLSLKRIFEKELIGIKRLFCVEEECAILSKVRPPLPNNDPLFLKFKGAKRLDPLSLTVLESLLQLRKEIAMKQDLPPFKVMGNSSILEIAENRPFSLEELKKIKGLGPRKIKSLGTTILKRIDEAIATPQNDRPIVPKKPNNSVNSKIRNRIKKIKEWREKYSIEQDLDPSLIFTNAQIFTLAVERPFNPDQLDELSDIRKWQKRLFGDALCTLLKAID